MFLRMSHNTEFFPGFRIFADHKHWDRQTCLPKLPTQTVRCKFPRTSLMSFYHWSGWSKEGAEDLLTLCINLHASILKICQRPVVAACYDDSVP